MILRGTGGSIQSYRGSTHKRKIGRGAVERLFERPEPDGQPLPLRGRDGLGSFLTPRRREASASAEPAMISPARLGPSRVLCAADRAAAR